MEVIVSGASIADILQAARLASCSTNPYPPERKPSGDLRFSLLSLISGERASIEETERFISRIFALAPDAEVRTSKARYKGIDDYRSRGSASLPRPSALSWRAGGDLV
jgi:hypothetical protein